jgi:hypothetical protein
VLLVEKPQVYPYFGGAKKKRGADPNDLITLALNAGGWLHFNDAQKQMLPHPRQWKGQVDKGITCRRVIEAFIGMADGANFRAIVDGELWGETRCFRTVEGLFEYSRSSGYPEHPIANMIDAIGILLWFLGRYK